MLNIENKIISLVNKSNYEEGKLIDENNILTQKTITIFGNDKIVKYKVKSSNSDNIYNIELILQNGEIISKNCTCSMYEKTKSCKHIAAVLIKHKKDLFPKLVSKEEKIDNNLMISKKIIDFMYEPINIIEKRLLKLEIELKFVNSYYTNGIYVYLKLGEHKLYSVNNKLSSFFSIYKYADDELVFGKEFIYNPNEQYFNENDTKILNYLKDLYFSSRYNQDVLFIDQNSVSYFMSLLKNSNFNVYPNYNFSGYIEKNPFTGNIIKENNLYVFDFDKDSNYKFLDFNNEYVVKDNLLYKVSKKVSNFILYTKNNNINNIYFEKSNLTKFVKGICNIFDEINISEDIKNEFTVIEPKVNLYFDMEDKIVCNIKFDYNGEIINFCEITENILRNETYENNVIQDIIHNNFFRKENLFYLSDIDEYDNFINMTLPIFSQKYTIFTTEKLDKINIIKKTNISSHFSIGKDNIFRYDFDFDGIDKKEFDSIFNSISNNKKYYKLKNGNILNLKDKALNEFKSLVYDMSLELDELEECKQYVIPKYKAIYLDSLKQNKYNIIKTNNLFDEFISNFKKYKNISLEIEDKILRNYQIIGLKWLYNIYKCGLGGILADEMGLGKSIQVIYLIKQILKEKCDSKVLIVAPTSLIYNWENEFNKFGSELKPKVIAGNRTIRKNMFENVNGVNIIITTYGLIKEDKEEYNKLNFELMVIDEAQNIKNPKSNITKTIKNINSNTRIALTGTPIENSVIELWSIFDFIMPGYLNSLNDFQIKYNIKSVENNELSKLDNLNMQINPFILRRKKEDVLVDLPPKIENNIYLDLTDDQKKIYLTELKKSEKEMNEIIEKEGFLKSRFKLLSLITKLRQICIDPKIVFDDYLADSIKINEACDTVKKIISENHKILIFTSYKKALEIVKEKLEKEKISCFVIDGTVSSKKRNELVNSFNNDDTNVFLIMLKAGGTGLNLTGADVVIHLDLWWNPQAENQATDRAHRIGQKNIVQVIKFICKGTIEERILELQNKKKILSDFLIDNGNNNSNLLSSLDENDFRNLFKYSYDE